MVCALVLVLGLTAAWLVWHREPSPAAGTTPEAGYQLAKVHRGTLSVVASLDGTLGYGTPTSIPIRASGTVTRLPRSGQTLTRGQVLVRVDNRPVVLMYGATPAYRTMEVTSHGAAMSGPDVAQLERNLAALGYQVTADGVYTQATADAVKAWQTDLGEAPTGSVTFGDVVFLPGPIRVVTNHAALGEELDLSAVQQTSATKNVTVSAPADSFGWATAGASARVTLPDQSTVRATVSRVGTSATTDAEGDPAVKVQLTLDKPAPKGQSGPVTVTYVERKVTNVLTVPVTALVALAEGGYGVQRADGAFVPVTPGIYVDGRVQVKGDIQAGVEVRVPQ